MSGARDRLAPGPALPAISAARQWLVTKAAEFMNDRMALPHADVDRIASQALDRNSIWIEYAHTPHLMHVGTARILLRAARDAADHDTTLVLFINDHLAARDLAESRYLPLRLEGLVNCEMPALWRRGGTASKVGMHRIAPPDSETIDSFHRRWLELSTTFPESINRQMAAIRTASQEATDYAAFLTRLMISHIPMPLCIATSSLATAQQLLSADALQCIGIFDARHSWAYCRTCGYRLGREMEYGAACRICESAPEPVRIPDVVGRQVLANTAGIALRYCGTSKPYQSEADLSTEAIGLPVPRRVHASGSVRLRKRSNATMIDRVNFLEALSFGMTQDEISSGADDASIEIVLRNLHDT